jgi:hypothetical protein
MKKFKEFIQEYHPEFYEEGFLKNLALSGALLGAGMGVGCSDSKDCKIKTNNAWQQKKSQILRDKTELQRKTQGLKSGESRTFIQGVPQQTNVKQKTQRRNKDIQSSRVTSDDAEDFLK